MGALFGIRGEHQGKTYALDEGATFRIGRSGELCDLSFVASSVSRLHATIHRRGEQYFVVDEHSRNKTFLDRVEIEPKSPVPLTDGARIEICGNELEFRSNSIQDPPDQESYSSTVEVSLSRHKDYLENQSARTLTWLLKLTGALAHQTDVAAALGHVLDRLFELFQKADRVLFFRREERVAQGEPYLAEIRASADANRRGYSRRLLQECLSTGNGIVAESAIKLGDDRGAESCVLSGIHSVMCAPLQGRKGATFGAIQVDTQSTNSKFVESDLQILMAVAQQLGTFLDQAEDQRALFEYKRDLEVARTIQRGLLPRNEPRCPGYEFVGFYESAREVGGDYYDLLTLDDGRVAVLQGDVAGKGIPAALFMARMSSAAAYAIRSELGPAAAFARLNKLALEMSNFDRFITMAAAIVDPIRHTVTLVNAGHAIPLLYSESSGALQDVMRLDQVGLPLGIKEDAQYAEWTFEMAPGSTMVMFTDGLTDSRNAEGASFGIERARAAISEPGLGAQALLDRLVQAVTNHQRQGDPFDDTTITCAGRIR